jgi:hypothetical protein
VKFIYFTPPGVKFIYFTPPGVKFIYFTPSDASEFRNADSARRRIQWHNADFAKRQIPPIRKRWIPPSGRFRQPPDGGEFRHPPLFYMFFTCYLPLTVNAKKYTQNYFF